MTYLLIISFLTICVLTAKNHDLKQDAAYLRSKSDTLKEEQFRKGYSAGHEDGVAEFREAIQSEILAGNLVRRLSQVEVSLRCN